MFFLCTNDTYCPEPELFDSVEDFCSMCASAFGVAPVLTARPDGRIVDADGATVLYTVDGDLLDADTNDTIRDRSSREISAVG